MGVRIGLVGQRADLAVEVWALAAQTGAEVVSLELGDLSGGACHAGPGVDLVVIDVAALGADPASSGQRGSDDPTDVGWSGGAALPGWPSGVASGRRGGAPATTPAVVMLCRAGEVDLARARAEALGCQHVVELPLGGPWLLGQLAPSSTSGVLGVFGAVGGAGASTVAIACAFGAGEDCLLVDADPDSPGLDLPLGIAEDRRVRWPDIPDTGAPLDPASLRVALPVVAGVAVLTGGGQLDAEAGPPGGQAISHPGEDGRLAAVLGAARSEFGRTVLDGGRGPLPDGLLGPSDAVVLVLPATLAGVVAGRRALAGLDAGRVLVLLRPTGWLPADEVSAQLGLPVALEVPRLRRAPELTECGDLLSGRTGRALRALGQQVWGQAG